MTLWSDKRPFQIAAQKNQIILGKVSARALDYTCRDRFHSGEQSKFRTLCYNSGVLRLSVECDLPSTLTHGPAGIIQYIKMTLNLERIPAHVVGCSLRLTVLQLRSLFDGLHSLALFWLPE